MKNRAAITEWMPIGQKIETNKGEVTAREWCNLEVQRMAEKGTKARVVSRHNGTEQVCAIYRGGDDVLDVPADAEDAK